MIVSVAVIAHVIVIALVIVNAHVVVIAHVIEKPARPHGLARLLWTPLWGSELPE